MLMVSSGNANKVNNKKQFYVTKRNSNSKTNAL